MQSHRTRYARRDFLKAGAVTSLAWSVTGGRTFADTRDGLIESIEQVTVRRRETDGKTWFSARACRVPAAATAKVFMTLQPIMGSDYFGPVHWSQTDDVGATWSEPDPVPGLGWRAGAEGIQEGVCDVVPEYHAATRTVLAIGHNVFYKGKFFKEQPPRHPVYVVRTADGRWSEARKLAWDDPRGAQIYSCGCAQRVTLRNGDVLIPFTFAAAAREHRAVATMRCSFDGQSLAIREVGNELHNSSGAGLLEPSLAMLDGRYYLTIRAEDGHGYVATSDDGLHWSEKTAWAWDDGQPLVMSTTQQRWLVHSDALYLVYTRRSEENAKVFRWRAPLYMAQVDRDKLRLIRATERVAVPLIGPIESPNKVWQLGNFHTIAASPQESWVTVGAFDLSFRGDLIMSRIRWKRENRLV